MKLKAIMMVAAVLGLLYGAALVIAATPNSPAAIGVNSSTSRSQNTGSISVPAQAGNVTQLEINDTRISTHWQGYYGSVNSKITLDDGTNSTFFDWTLAAPTGEIYAANASSVTWANITCVNFTGQHLLGTAGDGTRSKLNASVLESTFNITLTAIDGINETFNNTYGSALVVGDVTVAATESCPLAYMYINNASQQSSFQEVVLTDNTSVLFTALLEADAIGFNGGAQDFEMIVPENSGAGTTDFYFFIELS